MIFRTKRVTDISMFGLNIGISSPFKRIIKILHSVFK